MYTTEYCDKLRCGSAVQPPRLVVQLRVLTVPQACGRALNLPNRRNCREPAPTLTGGERFGFGDERQITPVVDDSEMQLYATLTSTPEDAELRIMFGAGMPAARDRPVGPGKRLPGAGSTLNYAQAATRFAGWTRILKYSMRSNKQRLAWL